MDGMDGMHGGVETAVQCKAARTRERQTGRYPCLAYSSRAVGSAKWN
jgi:hypothetical protein